MVNEIKLAETRIYTITIASKGSSDVFNFWLYQVDPPTEKPDTLTYGKMYSGTIQSMYKKEVVFEGTKDVTIRLGYNLYDAYGYMKYTIVTPSNKTLLEPIGSGVNEIKLSETGTYRIIVTSKATYSDTKLWYNFWLYQKLPPINTKTISFEEKISSKISQLGEPIIYKFLGAKEDLVLIKDLTSSVSTPASPNYRIRFLSKNCGSRSLTFEVLVSLMLLIT